MKRRVIFTLLLLPLCALAAAPESGKEKLRQLVRLPTLNMTAGFGLNHAQGFYLVTETRDLPMDLATVRKQIAATPTDPVLHSQLGKLLAESDHDDDAQRAYAKAAELYRGRLEAQPENGPLLTALAEVLAELNKGDESESRFREAVRVAPREWRCWLGLAKCLSSQALMLLTDDGRFTGEWKLAFAQMEKQKPTAERIALAQSRAREARTAFDRTVTLAPDEASVFMQRGLATAFLNVLDKLIAGLRGEAEMPDFVRELHSAAAVPDFKKAARLAPLDYRVNGNAVMFEMASYFVRQPQEAFGAGGVWAVLPDSARQSIGFGLARVEAIANGPNPRDAAGAWEVLALFQLILRQDGPGAAENARRAVTLDPKREQSWEILTGATVAGGNYENLLRVCEDRLKLKDSTRNRLMVAKSLFYLKREEAAAAKVKAALQLAPDDFIANLAQAALLLRNAKVPDALAQAEQHLARAGKLSDTFVKASRDADQTRYSLVDFDIETAVLCALRDDTETARRLLAEVLKASPGNDYAQTLQAALWQ